ncbi:hypothetical protein Nepgr_010390 [Nepenthes gracilis]|uniref:Uncharacterized protein n=1 Tax=Nepenthes gracilis TaxID=150966 RepID=A0AAD3XL97_NEPGR|nr:hypothetical protein Nepgr_010390 [Nepenthes gracilis]
MITSFWPFSNHDKAAFPLGAFKKTFEEKYFRFCTRITCCDSKCVIQEAEGWFRSFLWPLLYLNQQRVLVACVSAKEARSAFGSAVAEIRFGPQNRTLAAEMLLGRKSVLGASVDFWGETQDLAQRRILGYGLGELETLPRLVR